MRNLLTLLLIIFPSTVLAQSTGSIEGSVQTQEGEILPGANTTYQALDSKIDSEKARGGMGTDKEGFFSFSVPAGDYIVKASFVGYQSQQKRVTVSPQDTVRLVFVLEKDSAWPEEEVVAVGYFSDSDNFNLMGINYIAFGSPFEGQQERPMFDYSNQVKFRISVRYRALQFLPERYRNGGGTGIHLAFEQNSFWHLYDESSPFYDNNYQPGVFLRVSSLDFYDHLAESPVLRWLVPSLNISLFHESNGRDGDANRSWNRLGTGLQLGQPGETQVSATLEVWHATSLAKENADILDIAGRGEVGLHIDPYRRFRGINAHVTSNVLGETAFRNFEANLLFPLPRTLGGNYINPSLLLQFFHGYAENLLNYDEVHTSFRVGMAIVR